MQPLKPPFNKQEGFSFMKTSVRAIPALTAALSPALAAGPALAEESAYPRISAEGFIEVQNDWAYDSDDPDAETNNTFTHTEFAPMLEITEHILLSGNLVLEQTQDPYLGQDSFFDNQGVFIEELFAVYARDAWAVQAGKFNPAFGQAWSGDWGIWTEDFAEDYEITEKIGGGASYTFAGAHTLSAATFFADTSALSQSAITQRGQTRGADGGASNTGDLSSFTLSLEGRDIEGLPGLYYGLYLRHLGQGDADTGDAFDDEQGLAATLGYGFAATQRLGLDLLGEIAAIDSFEGRADEDRLYLTGMVMASWDARWDVTASYTARDVDYGAGGDDDDYVAQLTAGYAWDRGLYASAGWRGAQEAGVDTSALGAMVRYSFAF